MLLNKTLEPGTPEQVANTGMASSANNVKPAVAVEPAPAAGGLVPATTSESEDSESDDWCAYSPPRKSGPGMHRPNVRFTRAADSSLAVGPAFSTRSTRAARLAPPPSFAPATRPALAASPPAQAKSANPVQTTNNARKSYSAASARLLCEETFHKNKPSKKMMQLLELPSRRDVKMNVGKRGEPRILYLNRPENIEAVLMQLTGDEPTEPCKKCQRGMGPFGECIVSEMANYGACAGCYSTRRARECSLH